MGHGTPGGLCWGLGLREPTRDGGHTQGLPGKHEVGLDLSRISEVDFPGQGNSRNKYKPKSGKWGSSDRGKNVLEYPEYLLEEGSASLISGPGSSARRSSLP